MSTTVTQHVNGQYFLYEKDGEKVEVNAEDHYLIKKGICGIDWDNGQVVVNRVDKLCEYHDLRRKKMFAYGFEKERIDSLTS